MACVKFKIGSAVGIVSLGGPHRRIRIGSQVWHFEMHHYLGPMPFNRRTGQSRDGSRAFWAAVTWWAQQGEQIDADGWCVYERPAPPKLYHLGGRNYTDDPTLAARFGAKAEP